MIIDDIFRECVCFLCVEGLNDSGTKEMQERATGFFVGVQVTDEKSVVYLVTARHVIDESRSEGVLYAKMNLVDGGVRYVSVPQDDWTCHLSTDVAVIRFSPSPNDRAKFVRSSAFVDDIYIQNDRIDVGDELFFLGLFSEYAGDSQAEPIGRFGHVALGLKMIPLKLNSGSTPAKIEAYLAETKSWGGESGSPVFHCKWPTSPRVPMSMSHPRLLGLLHGHFDIGRNYQGLGRLDLNSGIGVVIPAKAIMESLADTDFFAELVELKETQESRRHPPTSAGKVD